MMITTNIEHLRDPFVLVEGGVYYAYGTGVSGSDWNNTIWACYKNTSGRLDGEWKRLDHEIYVRPQNAVKNFWAPEVHRYRGKYYLFATYFSSETQYRGVSILKSDSPEGSFVELSNGHVTPHDWDAIDGTFYVEDNVPYMVFCHEWVQVGDGEIWAVKLADDLSRPVEEPFLLFRASDNPYVSPYNGEEGKYVTDGPFLYREDGKLKMIWSSFNDGRYIVLEAESDSIRGKWKHYDSRYNFDAGHAMLFKRLDGTRMISLHSPNLPGHERPLFLKY